MNATRTAIENCNEQINSDKRRLSEVEHDLKEVKSAFHENLNADDWLGVAYTAKVISDNVLWRQRLMDRLANNEEWLAHIKSPLPITDHGE